MRLQLWEKLTGSFFVGFYTRAPGTVTSAIVFVSGWWLQMPVLYIALAVAVPLSFYLAYRFEKVIGHDPAAFTMDEVVGSLIVLCCMPKDWVYYIAFFIIWRLLDIFKPFIKRVEQIPQGIGMVLDDMLAAAATAGCYVGYTWLSQ